MVEEWCQSTIVVKIDLVVQQKSDAIFGVEFHYVLPAVSSDANKPAFLRFVQPKNKVSDIRLSSQFFDT